MCGIAGYISSNSLLADAEQIVRSMTKAVAHRGPDGEGIWSRGALAFGHRRLSILDLSKLGNQPMVDPESGYVIVFNGEVYNYIEIRKELIALGYRFLSGSDTEVILKSYEQWGKECVHRFNGMWSFSIYDPRHDIVFCSRDRFGIKPFYYLDGLNGFAFSSEIRQLLPLMNERLADVSMLTAFIVDRVAESPYETFFSNVQKLPAGHNLVFNLRTKRYAIDRYYSLEPQRQYETISFEDAEIEFLRLLRDSIRLRLRSDVNVGTCLSGGMDSSSIATLAANHYRQESGRDFLAITSISEDPSTEGSDFARMVVENSSLQWKTIRPRYKDFSESLDTVVETQEEPFSSASIFMQYMVMREARRVGVPVLLDGQGGDEILLGYERYFVNKLIDSMKNGKVGDAISDLRGLQRNGRRGALSAFAKNLIYFHMPSLRKRILRNNFSIFKPGVAIPQNSGGSLRGRNLFALQKQEIEQTNLPALLRYEDKNSMAHSIETRLPFLDYRMVEFSTSIPTDFKLRAGWGKYILRHSMRDYIPSEIAWRKHKFGFEAPESQWMSKHRDIVCNKISNSDLLEELIPKSKLEVGFIRNNISAGLLWRLYSVALWADRFRISGVSR